MVETRSCWPETLMKHAWMGVTSQYLGFQGVTRAPNRASRAKGMEKEKAQKSCLKTNTKGLHWKLSVDEVKGGFFILKDPQNDGIFIRKKVHEWRRELRGGFWWHHQLVGSSACYLCRWTRIAGTVSTELVWRSWCEKRGCTEKSVEGNAKGDGWRRRWRNQGCGFSSEGRKVNNDRGKLSPRQQNLEKKVSQAKWRC